MTKTLDVITIGRSSVDLYGDQVGGRLEDMGSFSKYVGGSPTNIACGTARLGLKSAVITGVGDEHMGRFILEQLAREGVDARGVKVDLPSAAAKAGSIPTVASPIVMNGVRQVAGRPSPRLGEHADDILNDPAWGGPQHG